RPGARSSRPDRRRFRPGFGMARSRIRLELPNARQLNPAARRSVAGRPPCIGMPACHDDQDREGCRPDIWRKRMDLSFSPEEIAFRDEVSSSSEANLPADLRQKVLEPRGITKDD